MCRASIKLRAAQILIKIRLICSCKYRLVFIRAAYQMKYLRVEKSERCERVHYANQSKEATDFVNRPLPGKIYAPFKNLGQVFKQKVVRLKTAWISGHFFVHYL